MSDFISLLQCPISGLPICQLSNKEVVELNKKIDRGDILHSNGKHSVKTVVEALKVEGKDYYYPVLDGIFCLLPHLVLVGKDEASFKLDLDVDEVNQHLLHFYDEVDWRKEEPSLQVSDFNESRSVSKEYFARCQERVKQLLKPKGQYLLEVARRPKNSQALSYSMAYEYTIFVDMSLQALRQTKTLIKENSFFILCDVTQLPFQANTLDGCVSLHTTQHIPKSQQAKAIAESYRVLKEESSLVVVYRWGSKSWLMNLLTFQWLFSPKKKKQGPEKSLTRAQTAHGYRWFLSEIASRYPVTLKPWRSVHEAFLQKYIQGNLIGKWLLKLIYQLEEAFPHRMARIGAYPMMVIEKKKKRLKREAYHV